MINTSDILGFKVKWQDMVRLQSLYLRGEFISYVIFLITFFLLTFGGSKFQRNPFTTSSKGNIHTQCENLRIFSTSDFHMKSISNGIYPWSILQFLP